MAALSDPAWPASLRDREQLIAFLYTMSVPSLATDIFNVEFHLGVYGSYAADETACIDDSGAMYSTFIFGRVITAVGPKPVFRVDGGPAQDGPLQTGLPQPAQPTCGYVAWTVSGGSWIEIDVGGIPVFRDGPEGLVRMQAARAADVRLEVGDWVLVRASLHRVDDRCGYRIRHFYVNAHSIRILALDTDTSATTDDGTLSDWSDAAGSSENGSLGREGPMSSAVTVVDTSDVEEQEELLMTINVPAVPATELTEGPSDEPRGIRPSGVQAGTVADNPKRHRSEGTESDENESRERNNAPSTPVRKVRRTSRTNTAKKTQQ
ncbi:hypothetical protein B0H14DRAFT_3701132 [Mycena olivaceomarginata]|nr:hypothetical protein B0H14DRAFT_3701132 [Mycena olivaceomarginata]